MRIHFLIFFIIAQLSFGQDQPNNGVQTSKPAYYLLKDVEVIISPTQKFSKTSVLIKDDKIVAVGNSISKPKGTVELNYEGKTIIPAFIELNSSLGMNTVNKKPENIEPPIEKIKNGNYYWNHAICAEFSASETINLTKDETKTLESFGFGFALSHSKNGIVRGNGTFIGFENEMHKTPIILNKASNHLSFEKGSSKQSYPSSQMGSIALLRQFLYDVEWYEKQTTIAPNITIDAYLETKKLPLLFETKESQEIARAQKIAQEFGLYANFIGTGNEYQQLEALKSIKGYIVLPLSFPKAFDVHDPYINREIPLSSLKHWELAPSNPYLLLKNGNKICLSADKCENEKEFWTNIKKAISRGLTVDQVLAALTIHPATLLGIESKVGTIEKDKFASFNIYSSNPFTTEAKLLEQWQMGTRKVIVNAELSPINGVYNVVIDGTTTKPIEITQKNGKYTAKYEKTKTGIDKEVFINVEGNDIVLQFSDSITGVTGSIHLHGKINPKLGVMEGEGSLPSGKWIKWSAVKNSKVKTESTPSKPIEIDSNYQSKIWFPNMAFGFDTLPKQETFIIKNVTAWTNEPEGILKDATVIIEKGKIVFASTGGFKHPLGAIEIDGKGMHLTSGIIDEHSHIAISKGVNEGGQAIASEVSIADVVNGNDINIYRQLAGGVTTSQLLHGSADPIGGQSAIIKLKWGMQANDLLLPDAPKFIKFALGENVKQSNWGDYQTTRFPQTRMGVEQVYVDAFTRAKNYEKEWSNTKQSKSKGNSPRRDLELDVLVEILNKERNITCHSYIQSEINMLMHIADTFGFKINTFTHILEGYKVADKMAKHGAGGSTFADWWAYKYEVKDAIPYNAKLMADQGVVVAINSDDAEMGRRLNQEAAKAVKYGGMSEQDAWKMVTLNPAKLLHLDSRLGSIKVGKEADLVLWTAHPLSIDAIADKVFIDGTKFYDRMDDALLRMENQKEKARIISKMSEVKKQGETTQPFVKQEERFFHCNTIGEEASEETNCH